MRKFMSIFLDADPGGGTGGGGGPEAGETAGKTAEVEKELEALRAENEKLKAAEESRKAKAEEERKARLTEEQKKAEEAQALRDSLVSQNRELQLKRAGLGDEYAALVTGNTAEEIKASGDLLARLVEKTKADAIASVKQAIAGGGAPGVGAGTDNGVSLEDFTKNILKGGK